MTPGDSIHAFSTAADTDPSPAGGHPHCGMAVLPSMFDPQAALDEVLDDERRLILLGVNSMPNLLFNRQVLVPGPADEQIYVKALDQALFPGLENGTRH